MSPPSDDLCVEHANQQWVFSRSTPFLPPRCTPNTKTHPCCCVFVFGPLSCHCRARKLSIMGSFRVRCLSFTPNSCRTQKRTLAGVFLRSAPLRCTSSMKTIHYGWFLCSAPFLQPRCMPNLAGAFFCPAPCPGTAMHVEHESAPLLVSFCVRRLFCHCDAFPSPLKHAEHKNTPSWCVFVFLQPFVGVFCIPIYYLIFIN